MEQITEAGLRVAADLSQRYGFSQDAVIHMMVAILRGRGGMAQFSHPEFGGSGQWMPGGMLMIGDMFNHGLKARVDALCHAIATSLGPLPQAYLSGSHQSQQQSGGGQQQQQAVPTAVRLAAPPAAAPGVVAGEPLFVPDPRDTWWPRELGTPTATGSQNDVRYAYFGDSGRLAVETNGRVSLYDTGEHRINGFAQQQSSGGPVIFSTPGGSVSLASLSGSPGFSHQAQVSTGGSQQQFSTTTPFSSMSSMSPMEPMQPMGGMAPMTPMSPMAPLEPIATQAWWPAELGSPDAAGAQNDLRYAYFAASGRLAVERGGRLTIHDVRGHHVQGVAASGQGADPVAIVVSTATGPVPLSALPEVSAAKAAASPSAPPTPTREASTAAAGSSGPSSQEDVIHALERLAELKEKGILSEAEFAAKKAELLERL